MATKKRSLGFRAVRALAILVAVLGLGLWTLIQVLSKPLPKGESGPAADELARAIERSVDKDAWARTGAVKWTFAGRNRHLWDRQRAFDRVIFGDAYVLCDLNKRTGIAFQKHKRVTGAAEKKLVDKAYAHWINDSFWLNPLVKLFDDGVTRSVVSSYPGQTGTSPALLISYNGGGLTPGDSYLWMLPQSPSTEQRPSGWRMWVSIIPIKGIENSWDGWTQLATGAWVATRHQVAGMSFKLNLDAVAGATTLKELVPGPDPFALLLGIGDVTVDPEGPALPEG